MDSFFTETQFAEQLTILIDIAVASLLAGIVGAEREFLNKPAGFRTQMIIGGSSALLMSLGKVTVALFDKGDFDNILTTDPIRIFEAIVVGVSFIGAGTIIKSQKGSSVHFLTTAATVMLSAGIGISVALKNYILAIGVTLLVLTINILIRFVEKKLQQNRNNKNRQD